MERVPPGGLPAPLPAGERGIRILQPLRIRAFALFFGGTAVSLFGDGVYLVAIAWQVYELSNVPTALSVVGVAWTLPMVVFLLVGGVLSDRLDRRKLLIVSDAVRALAIGGLASLALTGQLELWQVIVLVAIYGVGQALYAPASRALTPEVVPRELLVQANSLFELIEPIAYRFAGPAAGGVIVATLGTGAAFLVDAATFAVSAACVAQMGVRRWLPRREGSSALQELREGAAFVRSETWLWVTLISAALAMLLFFGPFEVLLPYVVKNEFGGGAAVLGAVFAASGIGALLSGLVVGLHGMARRHVLWMYLLWALSTATLAGYALAAEPWQAVLIGLVNGALFAYGNIVWSTLMQLHVPGEMLGRVSAIDWLISIGLTPVSFALAGPAAEAFGVEATMIVCGVLGSVLTLGFLAVPGLREPERRPAAAVLS